MKPARALLTFTLFVLFLVFALAWCEHTAGRRALAPDMFPSPMRDRGAAP